MKIFLDDIRNPPDSSWTIVRDYHSCIYLLERQKVEAISLDHDLGTDETGYDIACWIERKVWLGEMEPPVIFIHSANPVGRKNITAAIESMYRGWCLQDN